eukprot:g23476.t1
MVRLVQGIPAEKLLKVLESLEIEGILRLLEMPGLRHRCHLLRVLLAHPCACWASEILKVSELSVSQCVLTLRISVLHVWHLPNAYQVVQTMAGSVADVLADRTIAELVKHSTNTLQAGLAKADDVLARGQQARGAEGDGYKFGDFTVGLISMAVGQESLERGRELMEQHMEKAKQHSKPIQEGWEALQKDVAEKTESIQSPSDMELQNLHESLGQNALKIQAGLARGREKLSTLSCSSGTAYTKGLQDDIWVAYQQLVKGPSYRPPKLQDRVFFVTGANSGIGFEASKAFALAGATVVFGCRDQKRATTAMRALVTEGVSEAQLHFLPLDLTSLQSVRRCAQLLEESGLKAGQRERSAYGAYLLPFLYLLLPGNTVKTSAVLPWSCSPWSALTSLLTLEVAIGVLYALLRIVLDKLKWKQGQKASSQHKAEKLRHVSLCFLGRLHGRVSGVFLIFLLYFTAFYAVLFEMVRHVNLHISVDVLGNPRGLGICVTALVVIIGVLGSHLAVAFDQGIAGAYVGWLLLGLLLHGAAEATPGGRLHLHHWYWAFLASHYPIFDNPLSSLAQAAFMGIYIHGAACFGLQEIYYDTRKQV